jgi:putative spermidine/putrescine transport system permease protein
LVQARRATARLLVRHPRLRLGLLLSGPIAWLLVAYIGSLAALLVTSLFRVDPFTFDIVRERNFDNFQRLWDVHVYRTVAIRTVSVAAAVTIVDMVIAIPIAFYMAKVAKPSVRRLLVVAVLMPLWASYLVKAYAWRSLLNPEGGALKETISHSPGYGVTATVIVLAYLWLPYMILPIYAGLERLPDSLLEASTDAGAKAGRTFVSVVLPLLVPAIIAGSIFTFSLSLGDYITVDLVGGTSQMIGNVVFRNFGAKNVPFAAAYATVPVAIMLLYLIGVRRSGALDNL